MSGIVSGSEGGDVTQNGDNVFTGTNTYNVNLPTSGVTPTLSNQLITKAFADATYAGGGAAGDVFLAGTNAFTGTNTYNTNRPTSTIVGGVGLVSDDFITKADGDSIYGSGDGDALLAGGLSELNPQEFTGFNNFTKDTHFDENIDADDQIRMNGSSAQFRIAAFSMTSGDTAEGNGGNTLDQQNAGYYGNSIYQISGPVAVIVPAPNTCVFHQTGLTDIIRTEGKVQARLAPVAGEDLCNKTYVDATAGGGGSARAFQYQLTSGSAAIQSPWIFSGQANPPFVNVGGSYNPVTGFFTAVAADVGYWYFYFCGLITQTNSQIAGPAINILRSGTTSSLVRAFDNQGFQRTGSGNAYGSTNINAMVEIQVGDILYMETGTNTIQSYFTGQYSNFGGFKIG